MKRSNQIGWAQVRGGVFILLALIIFAGGVLLMGEKTKMFVSKGLMRIVMSDVVGLKVGAPVWLAGVDVGLVTDILFADPKHSNEVSINVEIDTEALKKIGTDSKITIKTRGLMGEKYVDILPSQHYSEIPPAVIRGVSGAKLDDVIQKAGDAFDKVNGIIDSIEQGKGTLGKLNKDDTLYSNVARLAVEMKELVITINRGDGTLGRLNRDPEPYNKLVSILTRADRTLQDIQAADGTLNRLIYDKGLYTRLTSLADKSIQAADDVRDLNKKIVSKDGSIGLLLNDREFYDKGMSLLTRAESSVKGIEEITAKVQAGNGTAGSLVNDKTLYDKMNRMVDDMDALVTDFKENPRKYIKFSVF
ncbi:MAG: MlaD family protein [Desulfuromonadaceae bacterium]|nr:MlaD family protein [Desulfuromonadaceae bacterium]MDD5104000.1 MlaD family protein [Desulfuromonadaceae bacterium]